MNLQSEKLTLIEWIAQLNDISVIKRMLDFKQNIDNSESDILRQEEIASIEQGLTDLENGNYQSHESARKIYEKYL